MMTFTIHYLDPLHVFVYWTKRIVSDVQVFYLKNNYQAYPRGQKGSLYYIDSEQNLTNALKHPPSGPRVIVIDAKLLNK